MEQISDRTGEIWGSSEMGAPHFFFFCGEGSPGVTRSPVVWVHGPPENQSRVGGQEVGSPLPAQGQMESAPNGGSRLQTRI